MIRKIKILVSIIMFTLILIVTNNVNASQDVTKKLYQDITINEDGSITIIEAALLSGEYNGRSREIEFKNYNANTFTGIYSNFTGNTDIYDGTSIKDIKIFDISQEKFNTIDDIRKTEKKYREVESASNGRYGVYTITKDSYGADFKIYCPSKKEKVFYMEYTITDAVVIHNDVAELFWNVIGDNYREDIEDFQVIVHLPGEDNDLRVWTHGPLTGANKIIDNKTVFFKDTNVDSYEPETIRIMFDKDLVPYGTKKSNVDGRENILKYEQAMADTSNAERTKLEKINDASQAIIDLEESPRIYYYNYAVKMVSKLDNGEQKTQFLQRIDNVKEQVNADWKEDIEDEIEWLKKYNYKYLSEYRIERLAEKIDEGIDEKAKEEYKKVIPIFNKVLEEKNAQTRKICLTFVYIFYIVLSIPIIYKIVKILQERSQYKGKYYRDFPSEDNPYVIEYLMKRKITNLSFSATVLNLIAKKVIKLEQNLEKKDNLKLLLIDTNFVGTESENVVLKILFKMVGKNNICTLNQLKSFGNSENNATRLSNKIQEFNKKAKKEAENKEYFKSNISNIVLIIFITINYIITAFMAIGVLKGIDSGIEILKYLGIITLISILYYIVVNKDKNRTAKGKLEYSKWLAHKRFLQDFSNFEEKDLPEITLWEKYLVTATILGCADKVERKMKLYINNYDTSSSYLLLATSLNNNFIRTINNSVNSSINTASYTVSSSSYSSGGGFGGGSSGIGGGRRAEAAVEVVSNLKLKTKNKKCGKRAWPFYHILIHMLLNITFLIFFL